MGILFCLDPTLYPELSFNCLDRGTARSQRTTRRSTKPNSGGCTAPDLLGQSLDSHDTMATPAVNEKPDNSSTSSNEKVEKAPVKGRFDKADGHGPEDERQHHALVDMAQIELKAEDLYDKEKLDIEQIDLPDVYQILQCTEEGLTTEEAQRRQEVFGPNALEHKERSAILHFLSFMWNPLSWVMEGAAIVAIALANGYGEPPDWEDFVGIVLLLLINASIGFYEERGAGNAVKALMNSLAPKAKVKRDGKWVELEAKELVPGDIIAFKHGEIIPADSRAYEAVNVSIDQAGLTGESLPVGKKVGDQCFSGSICKQGEAECVVIATGKNTFFGRAATLVGAEDDSSGHLQMILARIGLFCMTSIGLWIILELVILYPVHKYDYRRGINSILVLLIGGVPIAMPTVLAVTLAVGATQLAKYKAIVTRISAIEELAGVTILCSDKTGTLTTNKLTVDRDTVKTYTKEYDGEAVVLRSAYASRTENADAIDTCIVNAVGDRSKARAGITVLDFQPFDFATKRTQVTYRDDTTEKVYRVTKGFTGSIIELCTRNKTFAQEDQLEADTEEYARRGLRALAVAIENVSGGDKDGQGDGFELVGLLSIYDPPREDTKQTIDDAHALGVEVKMATGDQLAIAKETGRRLGLGDRMYAAKILSEGPAAGSEHANLDELIMSTNGFAGVFPEHKFQLVKHLQGMGHLVGMTGDGANDAPALSRANVGIAVEGATDAARSAADIVLTEPGLSTIVHAIRQSRVIFQRMRNYSMYACSTTIRIVFGFGIMATAFQFDMPPFMVLLIALINDGTSMTISVDRVRPSLTPDSWDLVEIFAYAFAFGLYQAGITIAFFCVIVFTTFFEDRFGVEPFKGHNDYGLHMVIYLQVAIMAQALIFVTRSQGLSYTERPSFALMGAFCLAQFVSSIIAGFADWGFSDVHSVSGGWIGIVWVWNIVTYFPMDFIKFGVRAAIKSLNARRAKSAAAKAHIDPATGVPITKTMSRTTSRHSQLYANRTTFMGGLRRKVLGKQVSITPNELKRFSSHQAANAGVTLQRSASRAQV